VAPGCFSAPRSHRSRDPLFGSTAWDDEEEEDDGPSLPQPPQDFGFGFRPGRSRSALEEFFRDVGEVLGVFGGSWAGPPQPFEPPLPGPSEGSTGQLLRDSMLKHPDSPAHSVSPG
ncbi:HAX1 protein, partial [Sula dactylatra]|nr:HAX1 protein [Sula dactylatra]